MRLLLIVVLPALFVATAVQETAAPSSNPLALEPADNLYHSNPKHIWNQLYDALFVRKASNGVKYGVDTLDPLLWDDTEYLLVGSSHQRALTVLDEFLRTHAERQVRDPLKRAIFQHDLWAIFDWSARRSDTHPTERRELQIRLAEVLRRLALTSEEIKSLPDNYAQAVASGDFAKEYDPTTRHGAFLPPDLLQPRSPWVCIGGNGMGPVAEEHVSEFSGRSRFFVFIRLTQGRKATFDYFRTLWNFPPPWEPHPGDPYQVVLSQDLPQFPAGTQVALVRQMTLFDRNGALVSAPITESVQIRAYRTISTRHDENNVGVDWPAARTEQDFYEIRLSRARLFADKAGGLVAVSPGEKEFPIFKTQGQDVFESSPQEPDSPNRYDNVILNRCADCHSAPGINSLQSRRQLLKPNPLQHDADTGDETSGASWWEDEETIVWKQRQYDWGLLNGYWSASTEPH